MTDFLSDITTPFGGFTGEQLLTWLAVAAAMLWLAKTTLEIRNQSRSGAPIGSPNNPLHARAQDRSPTWAELSALERRVEVQENEVKQLRSDMLKEFAKMREDGEKRASRLMGAVGESARLTHKRIDGLSEGLSYMKGKLDTLTQEQ